MKINGKVAVVTGAASGIGRATAEAFGRAGAKVHVVDIREQELEKTAHELGATAHTVDVTDPDAVAALHDRIVEREGRVDILHNNAGIAVGGPIEQMSLADWDRTLNVNLRGVVHGVHHFAPAMIERGSGIIVNTASIFGLVGMPYSSAYCTSKFAVVGLSESLDAELSPKGVRVLSVCPGLIDTGLVARGDVNVPGRSQAQLEDRWKTGSSPDVVARAVIRAVEREKARTLVPYDAHLLQLVGRLPAWVRHRLYVLARGRL
ncbi:MAG: SDR family oxidoreductase [Proteobacteria bacterium]|nr:SDR family oxidoreductase [Pseudomonadota bacterium]